MPTINIQVKKLEFRDENKVAFDSMDFVELALSEESRLKILQEWKSTARKTRFFVSSKVIQETYGVLVYKKNIAPGDAKDKISKVKAALCVQELQYDKRIDNKAGYELFVKYRETFNEECDMPDARIIAHYKRKGINVVYSEEHSVRELAYMVGLEGRRFPRDTARQKSQ